MRSLKQFLSFSVLFTVLATSVDAGVCDYRLSSLIGPSNATGAIGSAVAVASSNVAMQVSGIYLITNATTGAAMLGSTAAGASAAGTVGILAGSGAGAGAILGAISAPVTVIVAAAASIVGLGVEGGCYLSDERITDFSMVNSLVQQAVKNALPGEMGIINQPAGPWLWVLGPDGQISSYAILDLYIVNGELLHRDWGPNTGIGQIAVKQQG